MTVLLQIFLLFAAGATAAHGLARVFPGLAPSLSGLTFIGGLGGVTLGYLRGHILGTHHHHVAGMAMPGPSDATSVLSDVLVGGSGGAVLLLLAAIIVWLVPDKG